MDNEGLFGWIITFGIQHYPLQVFEVIIIVLFCNIIMTMHNGIVVDIDSFEIYNFELFVIDNFIPFF